jgi:hypothetical protein
VTTPGEDRDWETRTHPHYGVSTYCQIGDGPAQSCFEDSFDSLRGQTKADQQEDMTDAQHQAFPIR